MHYAWEIGRVHVAAHDFAARSSCTRSIACLSICLSVGAEHAVCWIALVPLAVTCGHPHGGVAAVISVDSCQRKFARKVVPCVKLWKRYSREAVQRGGVGDYAAIPKAPVDQANNPVQNYPDFHAAHPR